MGKLFIRIFQRVDIFLYYQLAHVLMDKNELSVLIVVSSRALKRDQNELSVLIVVLVRALKRDRNGDQER